MIAQMAKAKVAEMNEIRRRRRRGETRERAVSSSSDTVRWVSRVSQRAQSDGVQSLSGGPQRAQSDGVRSLSGVAQRTQSGVSTRSATLSVPDVAERARLHSSGSGGSRRSRRDESE
jgi:hypothetical protein